MPKILKNVFYCLTLYHTVLTFYMPDKEAFENIMGKGENANNQHFLLFLSIFYPSKNKFKFSVTFIFSSASTFNLDQSKNLLFGKG